jgi:hypothetical protein
LRGDGEGQQMNKEEEEKAKVAFTMEDEFRCISVWDNMDYADRCHIGKTGQEKKRM